MSFQKFETDSFCAGGRHKSSTVKIYVDMTSKGSKVLIGFCSICNRKNSMTVSDNTIQAEGLRDFFSNLRKKILNVSKKIATNVLYNPTRVLDITANTATAAVSRNPFKLTPTLSELITFYKTGECLYLGKFV